MTQLFKTLTLPLAMLVGFLLRDWLFQLAFLTPYMLAGILFITFCRISFSDIRWSGMLGWLLLIQLSGGVAVYLVARLYDEHLAQALLMCVFAPAAASSVVIGSMLGANIATMASFAFISNTAAALAAPILFPLIGYYSEIGFFDAFLRVFIRVAPLLLVPPAAAFVLHKTLPRVHRAVRDHQVISFYMWAAALTILTASTVKFIEQNASPGYRNEIILAAVSFLICIVQFAVGRKIGSRYGDRVAGGQALGQKNTVLAIWMAQTYLSPWAAIGPASYVLWQNIINSYQIWRTRS